MKLFFTFIFSLVLFSCIEDNSSITKTKKKSIDKKEFLNHEIINDSIHFKIKEYDKINHTYRIICVFNKDILLEESLIYKTQKKGLMDDGYFVKSKKLYKMNKQNNFTLFDINSHFHNYNLESIDTTITELIISKKGKIEIKKVLY